MTDQEIVRLLQCIRNLAMLSYPYPAHSSNDDALCFALGQIAGIASKALAAHERPPEVAATGAGRA
jgi:hypothetical protein